MKGHPRFVVRSLLLTCLAIPSCAPPGTMTYEQIEVIGRPHIVDHGFDDRYMSMRIEEGSRATAHTIWWDNDVLDRRRIDPTRRYQFKLLEGKVVDYRGTRHEHSEVWQVYDHQRLIYDASLCRVHARTMQRESSEEGIDRERVPRGFDPAKARSCPNSRFEHPACSSPTYSALNWTCPQCSEAETNWLEKNAKPPADTR